MKFPDDRVFVDTQRKILDHWLGPLKVLEPLLKLDAADFVSLQALIEAAQNPDGGDPTDPLELPIDASPDFAADYAVIWRTALAAGRRTPLSGLRSKLIAPSAPMSSNSSVSILIPAIYPHARLHIRGMSFSTTAQARVGLSEDGGTTLLPAAYELFNTASVAAAATGNTTPNITPTGGSGAAAIFTVTLDILDILGNNDKFAILHATLDSSGSAYTGSYLFTSTNPLNYVQVTVTAGTFDAGTVDLWGIP